MGRCTRCRRFLLCTCIQGNMCRSCIPIHEMEEDLRRNSQMEENIARGESSHVQSEIQNNGSSNVTPSTNIVSIQGETENLARSSFIQNECIKSGDACNVATPADELTTSTNIVIKTELMPSKNIASFEGETENTSGFIENECIKSGDACNIATPADELTLSKNIASFEGETENMTTSGYIENESGDACNVATPADELTPSKNTVPFEGETENMTTSDLTTSDLTTSGFIENECIKSGDTCNIATPADELTLSKNIASFEGETEKLTTSGDACNVATSVNELAAPTNIASIDGETESLAGSSYIQNECITSGDGETTPADELTSSTNITSVDGGKELIPLTEIVAIFQEEDKTCGSIAPRCDGGEEGQKQTTLTIAQVITTQVSNTPRTAREQGSLPEGVELVNLDASHPPPFKRHYAPSAYNRVYHPGFKLMAFHHLITMKRMAKFYSHI
ncbi:hypothetical protein EMCRGX_G028858 [Ephydatia muelleri]